MNIDRDVVNRALLDIGEEILTDDEVDQKALKWRVIKEFYLTTVTTALSSVPWTMGKRRKALVKVSTVSPGQIPGAGQEVNYSDYKYMYYLPVDCVQPQEIQGNHFYTIEGDKLLTDLDNASLLYISDGKLASPTAQTADDDYPDYGDIKMEPLFWEYIEKMLASKIAVKLSNIPQISQALFSMAMLIRQQAVEIIRATSGSRYNGERRWDEALNNYVQDLLQQNRRETQQ